MFECSQSDRKTLWLEVVAGHDVQGTALKRPGVRWWEGGGGRGSN